MSLRNRGQWMDACLAPVLIATACRKLPVSASPHYAKAASSNPCSLFHKVSSTLHLPVSCPSPPPSVCRPVRLIFTVYSLLIGIVSLGARLGVTYVAGTAVEHGQEMVISFSLTMMHPYSHSACSKRNRFESIKG